MAKNEKTAAEQVAEAVAAATDPNGGSLADRGLDSGKIQTEPTKVNTVDVEVVDAGYDVPEVHVSNLDRRIDDDEVGVYVPPEGRGTLDLPAYAFLNGKRPEDVFAEDNAPEVTDEDRTTAASDGKTARTVAEERESKKS